MKDKKDDLKTQAKDTVFAKIDETTEEAAQRRMGRSKKLTGSFVKRDSSDVIGELEDSDFSFVPEKNSEDLELEPEAKLQGSLSSVNESQEFEIPGDAPFGEAEVSEEPQVSAMEAAALAAAKREGDTPFGDSQKKGEAFPRIRETDDSKKDIKLVSKTKNEVKDEAPVKVNSRYENLSDEKLSAVTSDDTDKEEQKEESAEPEVKAEPEEMEVISDDEEKKARALSRPPEQTKAISKWAFWKRSARRDEQLSRISDGYLEMVDMVRAIKGQLETQNENNVILRDSLSHLPEAMKGIDKFNESQMKVGEALSEIHGQMERVGVRDDKLVDSMDGFNSTLQGMDVTNRETMKTFDQVQERMGESDVRMEALFGNVQETEVKVSDTMVKLQKSMAIMQGVFLFCLLVVIGLLVFFVLQNSERELAPNTTDPTPVETVQRKLAPGEVDQPPLSIEETPARPPREIQIPRGAQPLD